MKSQRGNFRSKFGVVLATAGSAVGLGNVWRFPFMTGQNGGAVFIIVYIICILLLGIPGMVGEFIIGRHSQTNAARAYATISRYRWWGFVGVLGIITSSIILGFYAVVAGWCLHYLGASAIGHLQGDSTYVTSYFQQHSTNVVKPAFMAVVFIGITHFVIVRGVESGIERASKVLMPLLFILLLVLVGAACSLPGAMQGVEFLLKPDFSKFTSNVFLEALGQAFFSLSLGTACLCTYASYFSRDTNLMRSASQIALVDCLIAVLAGLMIFPAAFSVGIQPDSGPSLIFITLPTVFQQAFAAMPIVGQVISVMFYALLVFAALTSTISLHEIGTAFFHEEFHIKRSNAAWIITVLCSSLAIACSLSVGGAAHLQVMGMSLMNFCDFLTAQIMLPLGAMLTCVLLGWFVKTKIIRNEITNWGTLRGSLYRSFLFNVRYVVPICILLILMHQLGVI